MFFKPLVPGLEPCSRPCGSQHLSHPTPGWLRTPPGVPCVRAAVTLGQAQPLDLTQLNSSVKTLSPDKVVFCGPGGGDPAREPGDVAQPAAELGRRPATRLECGGLCKASCSEAVQPGGCPHRVALPSLLVPASSQVLAFMHLLTGMTLGLRLVSCPPCWEGGGKLLAWPGLT